MNTVLGSGGLPVVGWVAMLLVGLSLGVVGSGGSILAVPILVSLFLIRPSVATGYSLFIVGLTSLIGSATFIRRKEIDLKVALSFAIPSFLAVFLTRRFVLPGVPEVLFRSGAVTVTKDAGILLVFSILMLFVSARMVRPHHPEAAAQAETQARRPWVIPLVGIGVGLLAGLVGVGGGFLVIPALVLVAGLPMRKAIGTSLLVIAIQSLLGFTGDVGHGQAIPWLFLLLLGAVASLGILGGSFFGRNISGHKLRPAFGWMLVVVGLLMLAKGISVIS